MNDCNVSVVFKRYRTQTSNQQGNGSALVVYQRVDNAEILGIVIDCHMHIL